MNVRFYLVVGFFLFMVSSVVNGDWWTKWVRDPIVAGVKAPLAAVESAATGDSVQCVAAASSPDYQRMLSWAKNSKGELAQRQVVDRNSCKRLNYVVAAVLESAYGVGIISALIGDCFCDDLF